MLLSFPRNIFRGDLSTRIWRSLRRFPDARAERAAGRATAKRPEGLARRASAANATNESGGEAETQAELGCGVWAATRSLRSARGAAHSGAARVSVQNESAEGLRENKLRPSFSQCEFLWSNEILLKAHKRLK